MSPANTRCVWRYSFPAHFLRNNFLFARPRKAQRETISSPALPFLVTISSLVRLSTTQWDLTTCESQVLSHKFYLRSLVSPRFYHIGSITSSISPVLSYEFYIYVSHGCFLEQTLNHTFLARYASSPSCLLVCFSWLEFLGSLLVVREKFQQEILSLKFSYWEYSS